MFVSLLQLSVMLFVVLLLALKPVTFFGRILKVFFIDPVKFFVPTAVTVAFPIFLLAEYLTSNSVL